MLPTPNTTFLRDDARCGHFTHANARVRNSANAAALASGLKVGCADWATGASTEGIMIGGAVTGVGEMDLAGTSGLGAAKPGFAGEGGWLRADSDSFDTAT